MAATQPATALYRRSTLQQKDSIERQREQVALYAARHGYHVTQELIDHKPGDEIEKRPGLQQLFRDAKAGKVQVLIVDEVSRLARLDLLEIAAVVQPLRKAGVRIEVVRTGPLDLETTHGRLMLGLGGEQAKSEVQNLSQRVLGGMLRAVRERGRVGGPVPFGYLRQVLPDGSPELVEEPEQAAIVRILFERYAQGASLGMLVDLLHDRGVRSPEGREYWSRPAVRKLLKNPRYLGRAVLGRRSTGKYHRIGNGNGTEHNPPELWAVREGAYPALVSVERFEQVQAKLTQNRKRTTPVKGGGDFRLTGLLVCGKCGGRFIGRHFAGRKYYQCSLYGHSGKGACVGGSVREDELLDILHRQLCHAVRHPESVRRIEEEAEALRAAQQASAPRREKIARQVERINRRIDQLVDRIEICPESSLPELGARVRQLKDERQRLEGERAALEEVPPPDAARRVLASAQDQLERFEATLKDGDPAAARECLRVLFHSVVLHLVPRKDGKRQQFRLDRLELVFNLNEDSRLARLLTDGGSGSAKST